MPHVTTAMRRSVRRGVGEIMLGGLRKRDITGDVSNVKNSFSSWDNCMNATYCKWPVIIAIIVVSLILLSIITCIIRCACCGMSCCCSCFSFLKCCDCCGDCCEGKRNKPMKHVDGPFQQPLPQQGYVAPAPMMGGGLGGRPEPPQFATFEVGKNGMAVEPKASAVNEDALPPMPSWETAAKKHVLTEEEKQGVELGELDPATGQHVPLMSGAGGAAISHPPSPVNGGAHSPYGPPGQAHIGVANSNGYMNVPDDQYGPNQSQTSFNTNGSYGQNQAQGGFSGPGNARGRGRGYGGPGRGYGPGPNNQQGYDGQGRGYGPPSPNDQYGSDNGFVNVATGEYGRPPPTRQYSSDSARPLNPGRQYSDRPYPADNFQPNGPPRGPSRGPGPNRMASPPLQNNSGFDFGTGNSGPLPYPSRPSPPPQQGSYGRPVQGGGRNESYDGGYAGSTAPPSYASRSPPPQEQAYPGYRPYQPATQGQGGRGNGRGGREPQGWDPVHQ